MRKEYEVQSSPLGGKESGDRGIVEEKEGGLVYPGAKPAHDEELDERGRNRQALEHRLSAPRSTQPSAAERSQTPWLNCGHMLPHSIDFV